MVEIEPKDMLDYEQFCKKYNLKDWQIRLLHEFIENESILNDVRHIRKIFKGERDYFIHAGINLNELIR